MTYSRLMARPVGPLVVVVVCDSYVVGMSSPMTANHWLCALKARQITTITGYNEDIENCLG